jgi:hypothetical protein
VHYGKLDVMTAARRIRGAAHATARGSAAPEQTGAETPGRAYHLELRQFPHNVCRFNLGEAQLRTSVVEPWAREQWIELGDRKWNPHQAKLTVIEGPPIPLAQLSLGRGWRTARREGRDVTAELLASAGAGAQFSTEAAHASEELSSRPAAGPPAVSLIADSLGLELLAEPGAEHVPLRRAWELAAARLPDRTAGESLALAERAVDALLRSGLIVLVRVGPAGSEERLDREHVESALRRIDSWTEGVWIGRV